jgi:hypothetical protein
MSLANHARKALDIYIQQTKKTGTPHKLVIRDAVTLTVVQRASIEECLTAIWKRPYPCPPVLHLSPKHGYESRVLKDGFSPEQYVEWIERGCSNDALVSTDGAGRPHLLVQNNLDFPRYKYNIVVTLRADAHGSIQIDDVIPRGLPAGAKK